MMTQTAKGLYATRFVDITFAVMAVGSAVLLTNSGKLPAAGIAAEDTNPLSGVYLFGAVVLVAISACIAHNFDRRGWDDYMGQIVSQSALIGMITVLLSGAVFDFLIAPAFGARTPDLMIQGMVPIGAFAWAFGYGFLRWRGTNA